MLKKVIRTGIFIIIFIMLPNCKEEKAVEGMGTVKFYMEGEQRYMSFYDNNRKEIERIKIKEIKSEIINGKEHVKVIEE